MVRLIKYNPKFQDSLSYKYPHLADEFSKQNNLLPWHIKANQSHKKYIWQCSYNPEHIWKQSLKVRIGLKTDCPYCMGQKVNDENSLGMNYHKLLKEWNYELNNIHPNNVNFRSNKKYHWICKNNKHHKWLAVVRSRTILKTDCPYCRNLYVSNENNLAVQDPDLAKLFYTKKNNCSPFDVIYNSYKKYWWKCSIGEDHIWQDQMWQVIDNRKRNKNNNNGCPFCAGRRYSTTNSLLNYPHLLKEWDYKKNGILPFIKARGHKKYWWICSKNHSWQTSFINRIGRNSNCPICSSPHVNQIWRDWEKWCEKIAKEIYQKDLILQPQTRLSNNKVPDLIVRTKNELIIIDAKTHTYLDSINEDIQNYSPYCDKLEFWCLLKERESIFIQIKARKIQIDFINPHEILKRLKISELQLKFEKSYKTVLERYLNYNHIGGLQI